MILFQGKRNTYATDLLHLLYIYLLTYLPCPVDPQGETIRGHALLAPPHPSWLQSMGTQRVWMMHATTRQEDRGKIPSPDEVSGQRGEGTLHLLEGNAHEMGPENRQAVPSTN